MKQAETTQRQGLKKIFSFIAEAGMLMQMSRSHKQHLGNAFDTVSSHSHHCAIISYCLARMEKLSHEEGLKAIAMSVVHDLPEARTGDLNYVEKHYATTDEQKALNHQLQGLPFAEELAKMFREYEERETLTAKCAKDADAVEQLYQEWVLAHMGNKMAERWLTSSYKTRVPYLRTKSAKKLVLIMKNSYPHQWWFEEMVEQNPNLSHLNGKK